MANFDMAEMALKSICPTNCMKYDDKEMPSIMVYIPKFRLCDVLSTTDISIHPAFRKNGVEIDGFCVGKFQSHHYNGRAYSLPCEDPTTNITLDDCIAYNRAKGKGWHEITAAEWAAIALWCHKIGCEPLGNNSNGKDNSETVCKAIPSNPRDGEGRVRRVATGTGPVSWSHDGTLEGVWDLNGNCWEWCTGIRLVYGEIQIIADNNAADSAADLSEGSSAWKAINAADGSLIDPNGKGTTAGTVKLKFSGNSWVYSTTTGTKMASGCNFASITADTSIGDAARLLLQALAMLPDTNLIGGSIDSGYGNDYFYIDTTQRERCLFRGGYFEANALSGVFCSYLSNDRSSAGGEVCGRSAYID